MMRYTALPRHADDFQQPPGADLVARFCARLLGDVPLCSATEIGGGMFNTTFLITAATGQKYALRISPPHDHPMLFSNERYLLRREYALAPFLSAGAPLMPRVMGADFTCTLANRDVILSSFIEGENWDAVKKQMSPEHNDIIWRQLGSILRAIHATPAERFGWPDPEPRFEHWSAFILHAASGLLRDFPRFGVDDTEPRAWLAAVEQGTHLLDEIRVPRVVHGDPWPKNVLIDRSTPRIVGLLDHERGLFGDPMDEWVFHHIGYPASFWEAYGPRPVGPSAEFRNAVYLGLIDVQLLLEGVRYRFDANFVRPRLRAGTDTLRRILAG